MGRGVPALKSLGVKINTDPLCWHCRVNIYMCFLEELIFLLVSYLNPTITLVEILILLGKKDRHIRLKLDFFCPKCLTEIQKQWANEEMIFYLAKYINSEITLEQIQRLLISEQNISNFSLCPIYLNIPKDKWDRIEILFLLAYKINPLIRVSDIIKLINKKG